MAIAYSQGDPSPWKSSLLPKWGTGAKQLLPSMAVALSYRWGTGRSPSPVDGHSLLPGRSFALEVFIITQMRDRGEAAAPVDGCSIIVQMGDGELSTHIELL